MKFTIKPAGWALIGLFTLGIAVFAYKYFNPSTAEPSSSTQTSTSSSFFSKNRASETVTIIVNTYCGFSPIALLAENYAKEKFNLNIKLKVIDDFEACRAAFINNDAQMAYCTLDALPVEMSSSGVMASEEIDAVYFLPLNFSAGADAMVVNKSINSTQDLKGKKVAYAEGTASHTLLLNILETSGLSQEDIIPIKVSDGVAARDNFNAKSVDAACVWAPDDIECLRAVPGSKVLASTKDAPLMISDGLIAKRAWLNKNKELAIKVAEAIYWANSEVMYNQDKFDEAAEAFAKIFKFDVDIAKESGSKINYMTIADAYNWMGLNTDYTGAVGSTIYTKMCTNYSSLKLCKSPVSWSAVSYPDIVKALYKSNNLTTFIVCLLINIFVSPFLLFKIFDWAFEGATSDFSYFYYFLIFASAGFIVIAFYTLISSFFKMALKK